MLSKSRVDNTALLVREAIVQLSCRVQQINSLIKPETVPDHVNYASIEKFLRSVNVEVNQRMFVTCIRQQLLPGGDVAPKSRLPLYTHEQIIYYLLVDLFKPVLPPVKIKGLLYDVLRPMVYIIGLDATYVRLCENLIARMDSFDNAVALAIQNVGATAMPPDRRMEFAADAVVQAIGSIAYYTCTD